MKAFAITNKGMEDLCKEEIKELISCKNTEEKETIVKFDFKNLEDICYLCYNAQSVEKIIYYLGECKVKEKIPENEIKKIIEKIKWEKWLNKGDKFRVKCKREGEHDFSSQDIEQNIGRIIKGYLNKELKLNIDVELDAPDLIVYAYVYNNKLYLGIDFAGKDLSKRQYKIFNYPTSLKGTIGFGILKFSEFNPEKDKVLVNLFCHDGVIAIESTLYVSGLSVNYYDKEFIFRKIKPLKDKNWEKWFNDIDKKAMKKIKNKICAIDSDFRNIKAAKKNSKIAGIDKIIEFSKKEVDFLDIRFKEDSVDKIISYIPSVSKRNSEEKLKKLYDELFYQLEFILKENGSLNFIARENDLVKEKAERYFKLIREKEVWTGKKKLYFLQFELKKERPKDYKIIDKKKK
ncbi:hypothetical protein JW949_03845 [Candidatus Woesearchaeota archaeon]|nr:hypothetical protein [Candidatus Woesearchaeota archaeon]